MIDVKVSLKLLINIQPRAVVFKEEMNFFCDNGQMVLLNFEIQPACSFWSSTQASVFHKCSSIQARAVVFYGEINFTVTKMTDSFAQF